jgi:hypothetical protein
MADSITAEQTLPPGYIDPEHSGADRKLLEVFYAACNSEGGTADEIHLRGIRAVLAAQPAPPAEGEVADEELLALKSWSGSTAFESDLVDICRAAIALDRSRRAPVPPAEGEVGELVAWLRENAEDERQMCESANRASLNLDRCAALLQQGQSALHRLHRLQQENARFREPERTILCDLLANGTLLPDPDGKRYGVQPVDGEVGELAKQIDLWLCALSVSDKKDYTAKIQSDLDAFRQHVAALLQHLQPPQPVPVSERLPGPEDCDAEGRCWLLTVEDEYPQWRLHSIEGNQPGGATMIWVPVDSSPGVMVDCFYTSHWLPFHALPTPTTPPEAES